MTYIWYIYIWRRAKNPFDQNTQKGHILGRSMRLGVFGHKEFYRIYRIYIALYNMIPDLILPHLMSVPLLYVFISPYMSVITVYFEFGFGNSTTVLNIQSRGSNIEIEIRKQHWNFSKSKTVFKQPNSKMLSPNQNSINQFWKTKVLKWFSQLPPRFF